MKPIIQQEIRTALAALKEPTLVFPLSLDIDYARNKSHGDFSSNIALVLAKSLNKQPLQLAKKIIENIDCSKATSIIEKVEIAGPGFINFFLKKTAWYPIIKQILKKKEQFGTSETVKNVSVLVEFVSANPTGPLHVGHGRGAAYGDSLVKLLRALGYHVHAEYYVNDAGRQMDILATSVWIRYLQTCGELIAFPSNAYKGAYILEIVEKLSLKYGKQFYKSLSEVCAGVPPDDSNGGDKEAHIDALILKAKMLLGQDYQKIFSASLDYILDDIEDDLSGFRVNFNKWFSEKSLFKAGFVDKTIERLKASGYTYNASGALWFKSSEFGDDKDRVLIRENGQATYFAADAAYRLSILEDRGFKKIINVLGADHHGYIARISAVIQALGYPADSLTVLLVQFAVLYRGKEKIQMSTRSGEFITLRKLRREVGNDAARFFYVLRRSDQHMDFDLELAKKQSNANPVYYVQYAYARICSVLRQLEAKKLNLDKTKGYDSLNQLKEEQEFELLILLNRYPEILEQAASNFEPHIIVHYLRTLAQVFHAYYNQHVILVETEDLRNARLSLIISIQQVLKNGLGLLGVETLEIM